MADDQSQRPYRASEPPPARGSGKTGSDPLAELARLIGQTDPFGEYGREAARRSPPSQSVARADWNQPLGTSYTAQYGGDARAPAPRYAGDDHPASPSAPASPLIPQDYGSQNYEHQPYEAQPRAGGTDPYAAEQGSHRFPLGQSDAQQDFYDEAPVEDEYYEEAPPSRRRMVVMAIAGVTALAVIGTAGAFGYRALVGSSGSAKPPPVIKADTAPSKIVPATTGKDAQSNKLITDRVNERGQSERLVSREEQPMDRPTAAALSQSGPQMALGSGVVGSEPKKVRTIAIHPDQPVADAAPSTMSAAAAPARPAPALAPRAAAAPPRPAPDTTADVEEGAPAAPTRSAQPPRQAAAASGNSPLSLNPNAAPSRAAPAPAPAASARTASVAPQAPAAASTGGGAGSYVQVSSQRSEGEAQAAFRSLQAKFPDQLGGRQSSIRKVDLGAKGTYYRAMVGPFANATEASQLCSSLKAAGGQCLVQRN
ncbi:MAG TPA: SPOR domain-containing protein [Pseudolabrys sp.]|nr:SPOR domain-containing protein [Pseudolabrys sp.]